MNHLHAVNSKLYLDDAPFQILSGDLQYFRVHPSQWRARLELMRDFGLNTVQTYCPWNLHEPERGKFDFSGQLDLAGFIGLCQELGLYVLLRPSPYICAEWDFGGLPAWLVYEGDVLLRSRDERYLAAVRDYYRAICREFVPYLATRGGNVLAVALENEFGGIALDKPYLAALRDILTENGVDVPFYTTDGASERCIVNGTLDDCLLQGLNYRSAPGAARHAWDLHQRLQPQRPFFVGELWGGRAIYWDEPYAPRDPGETAIAYKEALELGASVNFYMFSGGTNYGFMSGSVVSRSFTPRPDTPIRAIFHCTSYDEDSLISEDGLPTAKYYACRAVLDAYLGKPVRPPETLKRRTQAIPAIALTGSAALFDNLDVLTTASVTDVRPRTMEEMGQDYGFILCSTVIPGSSADVTAPLALEDVRDRATVYAGGAYIGTLLRDREAEPLDLTVPASGETLDILVENMGRRNGGRDLHLDRRGILGPVSFGHARLVDWTSRSLPLRDLSGLRYGPRAAVPDHQPVFLRGIFDAQAGVDTFVSTRGFGKGYIWINGTNIGRYWSVGPQMSLYVPGALLRETGNVIEILDVSPENAPTCVNCIEKHDFNIELV